MASKRRGRGEGSIYFDEERQLWVSQVSLGTDPMCGKRRRKTVYGATKQEVLEKLLDLQQQAADGRLDRPEMPVGNFLEFWLIHVKGRVRRTTYWRYEAQVNKLLVPFLGKKKLADLSAFDVAQMYRDQEAAGVTVGNRHAAGVRLRQALRYAVRFGLLHSSPADRVDIPARRPNEIRPLDPGQFADFLRAAALDRYYALFLLAVDSGARMGELTALTWDDLNEARMELTISKSLEQRGKGAEGRQVKEPKTACGRRRVVLAPTTVAELRKHRERMKAEGHGSNIMFPNTVGKHTWQASLINHHFRPILARAGLKGKGFRPHDLRHTCATLLLLAGVHVKVVSERLGHANITITLQTYSHVLPTMQTAAAERMEAALTAALSAPPPAKAENGSSLAANGGGASGSVNLSA
jgi:integrase